MEKTREMTPDGLAHTPDTEKLADTVFLGSALLGAIAGAVLTILYADRFIASEYAVAAALLGSVLGCWGLAAIGTFCLTPLCTALSRHHAAPDATRGDRPELAHIGVLQHRPKPGI